MHQADAPIETLPPVAFARLDLARSVGWAVVLACSWTWCIGMYLPVLLARDFGPWAWAAFALPNCIGAAWMGVALRAPGSSERFTASHALACRAFSIVTIAFQLYFAFWILAEARPRTLAAALGAAMLALAIAASMGGRSARWTIAVAALALSVSLGCAAWWMAGLPTPPTLGSLPSPRLPDPASWLIVPMGFGFLLCPYLDLTFHRARRGLTQRTAPLSFQIGFMGIFPLMIALTMFYAPAILDATRARGVGASPALAPLLILVHLAVQLGFTIGLHRRESGAGDERRARSSGVIAIVVAVAAVALAAILPTKGAITGREVVYWAFLGCYGTVFPAYVWVVAIPTRRARPTRAVIALWLLACLAAFPMYWLGLVEGRPAWLAPGAAVMVLAGLAAWPLARAGARVERSGESPPR